MLKFLTSLLAALVLSGCGGGTSATDGKDPQLYPRVRIETNIGNFVLELDAVKAPKTTHNFMGYVRSDYYIATVFHRIVPGSMVQGGAYRANTSPKMKGLRLPVESEWPNGLENVRGTVAMVRKLGLPNSATSEFYINIADNPLFDRPTDGAGYLVFGKVVQGMEVVDQIAQTPLNVPPGSSPGGGASPIATISIRATKMLTKYDFDKGKERIDEAKNLAVAKRKEFMENQEAKVEEIIKSIEEEFGVEVITTPSGLAYATLQPGDGATPPSSASNVTVHYTGWLVDGTKFDSSVDRGEPATFPLNGVIGGWTEGVGSMKIGEKRRLIIPSDLGYGERGSPPDIPGGATLIFDVELLAIK